MEIHIDGQPDLAWAEEASTVGKILESLEDWLRQNGRAILEVRLDGEALGPDRREVHRAASVDDFKRMEVTSISVSELSVLTLRRVADLLPNLADGLGEVARKLQKGEEKVANQLLLECVEGIRVSLETVEQAASLAGVRVSETHLDGKPFSTSVDALKDLLVRARDSIVGRDSVVLADLVEHEMAPAMRDWGRRVGLLADQVQAGVQDTASAEGTPAADDAGS